MIIYVCDQCGESHKSRENVGLYDWVKVVNGKYKFVQDAMSPTQPGFLYCKKCHGFKGVWDSEKA